MAEQALQERRMGLLAVARGRTRRSAGGIHLRADGEAAKQLGNRRIVHCADEGERRLVSLTVKKLRVQACAARWAELEGGDGGRGFYSLEKWAL